jgi:uncharacterized membrane protein YeaQ/YmgE (transglycosylase-associated protein family)
MTLTVVLIWLLIGLIAGFLASHVMGGGHGIVVDILIGLVGAVVGGFILGNWLGYAPSSFIGHVIVAFLGAALLLGLVRMLEGPRRIFR